ncbi:zf-HC2 domain-containing protein [Shewanella yunxiaonensis]|uniref:Zf-HC2 domain-containing protein n=1 Tax=Shewanella yunxiaonensis TaxID=2829809 RepID=A0ABX7YVQ4_9GAMM|nr:zf-HC2 domain-containing protein [Shewanella yunxiaonensis]QUN06231.1 zf-HC2 domain-containing protein [Shewanella yunxiaonensis]
MILNCREAARLLSEAQERELSLGERLALRLHLMFCAGCRNFGKHVNVLRDLSRQYASGRRTDGK